MHPSRLLTLLTAFLLALALGVGLNAVEGATPAAARHAKHRKHRIRPGCRARARHVRRHHRRHWRRHVSRRDIDGDGIPNRRDRDIDGDGIPNGRDREIDGDRILNRCDQDMDADRVRNARDRNIDGDRLRNTRDPDMDADRVPNARDRNMDGDTRPNSRDRDIDGDGIPNGADSDMDQDGTSNRLDRDMDGDGIPNYRDPDSDTWGSVQSGVIPAGVRLARSFFGIVADQAASSSGDARARVLGDIASLHVGTIRQKFEWSRVEVSPGVYDFRLYDSFVGDLAARGFSILPVLFDPPSWRSSRPRIGAHSGTYPPRSNADFAYFAAQLVRRYGPNGSFWSQHPWLPYRPLRAWQVWNEPQTPAYWANGPNAAQYVAMLRTVGAAIKRVDRGAEVVAAGLSDSSLGIPLHDYLRQMYAAGARGSFDRMAVHPYAPAADSAYDIVADMRRVMDDHGDGAKPIWVTELGWATWGENPSPFNVGTEGQGEVVKRAWAALVAGRSALGLRGLAYYSFGDIAPYAPHYQDFFGLHTGLMQRDGVPKPAFWTFKATVNALTR